MAQNDLFAQINNAVLDLQSAQLQSYDRPLKRLASLLRHPHLTVSNEALTKDVDLDRFIEESARTQGGMAGSARLLWPDDLEQTLGLTLLLIWRFAEKPDLMAYFGHQYYYSNNKIMSGVNSVTSQIIIPFVRDYKEYVLSREKVAPDALPEPPPRSASPTLSAPPTPPPVPQPELLTLKPSIWGISIDLKELGRRARKFWRRRK